MDLIFSKDSLRNATLSLPTGECIYELFTPDQRYHQEQTTITKFQHGSAPRCIGVIELHSFQESVVNVERRSVLPRSRGLFKSGKTFTSYNGQRCTWKRRSSSTLLLTDKSHNTLAIYEESSSNFLSQKGPSPAKLSIAAVALELADEIVGTFAYIEQQERRERRRRAAGAVHSTTMGMDSSTGGSSGGMDCSSGGGDMSTGSSGGTDCSTSGGTC